MIHDMDPKMFCSFLSTDIPYFGIVSNGISVLLAKAICKSVDLCFFFLFSKMYNIFTYFPVYFIFLFYFKLAYFMQIMKHEMKLLYLSKKYYSNCLDPPLDTFLLNPAKTYPDENQDLPW